jgi:hypothetical protein
LKLALADLIAHSGGASAHSTLLLLLAVPKAHTEGARSYRAVLTTHKEDAIDHRTLVLTLPMLTTHIEDANARRALALALPVLSAHNACTSTSSSLDRLYGVFLTLTAVLKSQTQRVQAFAPYTVIL